MKQQKLFKEKVELEHGGDLSKGRRKTARPLASRNPIHLVLGILAKRFQIKWRMKPFTRVAKWGRDFVQLCNYVLQNQLEAFRQIPKQPRGRGVTRRRHEPPYEPTYGEMLEAVRSEL